MIGFSYFTGLDWLIGYLKFGRIQNNWFHADIEKESKCQLRRERLDSFFGFVTFKNTQSHFLWYFFWNSLVFTVNTNADTQRASLGMPFTVILSKVLVALFFNFRKRIHHHTETEAGIWPWNFWELFYRLSTLEIVEEQSNHLFLASLVSFQVSV